ncbi:MAG: hypothetical protein AAFO07_23345 [Bacteroidota bacterium]
MRKYALTFVIPGAFLDDIKEEIKEIFGQFDDINIDNFSNDPYIETDLSSDRGLHFGKNVPEGRKALVYYISLDEEEVDINELKKALNKFEPFTIKRLKRGPLAEQE